MIRNHEGKTVAICAGSFDPPSFGHVNILERALNIVDHLIVAIGLNSVKGCLFSVEERMDLLRKIFKDQKRLEVDCFKGLLVDYANKRGVKMLIRGVRTVGDYEYELQMALTNRMIHPEIDTIFMMTEGRYSHISSSIVKQVVSLGGSVKGMVHPVVEKALQKRLVHVDLK